MQGETELDLIVRQFEENPSVRGKASIGLISEVLGPSDWLGGPGDDAAILSAADFAEPRGGSRTDGNSQGCLLVAGEAIFPPFVVADPHIDLTVSRSMADRVVDKVDDGLTEPCAVHARPSFGCLIRDAWAADIHVSSRDRAPRVIKEFSQRCVRELHGKRAATGAREDQQIVREPGEVFVLL